MSQGICSCYENFGGFIFMFMSELLGGQSKMFLFEPIIKSLTFLALYTGELSSWKTKWSP